MKLHFNLYFKIQILLKHTSIQTQNKMKFYSRGAAGQAMNVMNALPPQMRQQVNQAVTNAAMNELSNVFASKFK